MWVSKSSDHWCAFGTMSNFEKRSLRSGYLLRPGHVTFWVIGSSCIRNVSNCWLNSYGKFGGATRRRFFAICEKPYGGGVEINPPPVRGLNLSPLRGPVDISAGIRGWCQWWEPGSSPGVDGHSLPLRVMACVFVAGTAQRPESVSGRRGPCPVYRAR